jgi:hypothetical protein
MTKRRKFQWKILCRYAIQRRVAIEFDYTRFRKEDPHARFQKEKFKQELDELRDFYKHIE